MLLNILNISQLSFSIGVQRGGCFTITMSINLAIMLLFSMPYQMLVEVHRRIF